MKGNYDAHNEERGEIVEQKSFFKRRYKNQRDGIKKIKIRNAFSSEKNCQRNVNKIHGDDDGNSDRKIFQATFPDVKQTNDSRKDAGL
jgi:hypothetical protein